MFKDVQSQFVHLGDGADPQTISKHYGVYYDTAGRMFKRFGCFKGLDDIHPNIWPVICLLADQQKRIEELEARIVAPSSLPVCNESVPKPRVDLRTRQGRALKEAQPVGV